MAEALTTGEILVLRTAYLRDQVDEAATPKVYLSSYNKATREQFVSDAVLESMNQSVEADAGEELDRVRETKRLERVRHGDTDEAAATKADAIRLEAKFRLVRARVRRLMLASDLASIADARGRAAIMAEWRAEIGEDERFTKQREGAFASVPLFRR